MGGLFSDRRFILGIIFALWRMCLAKETPANFVFGDSLVEAGNNNYIVTLSKADYPPNGIDFGKPTGRYTNGRTIIDIIGTQAGTILFFFLSLALNPLITLLTESNASTGQNLGFKGFTPPYLAPTTAGPVILKGANYASGGGGILNETGKIFVRTPLFFTQFHLTIFYLHNELKQKSNVICARLVE